AVANSTSATFLRVVGSELIQKYLGDGPKLVRELFRVADDLSPSIVFIDEIDAIGTKRYDAHSGGEREIQRTMLELLNQLDGFDSRGDVKVILATNKIESLDPALLRPGRIDRKIEFPLPDIKTRRRIFQIHTSRMTLSDDVNLEEFVMTKDEFSGADIKAICTEAGLLALRERRMKVTHPDFKKAKDKVMFKKKEGVPEGLYMVDGKLHAAAFLYNRKPCMMLSIPSLCVAIVAFTHLINPGGGGVGDDGACDDSWGWFLDKTKESEKLDLGDGDVKVLSSGKVREC
ncbi:26S proteasome regulatory subunit 4 homolog A, partial [Tanacetum coccineum]